MDVKERVKRVLTYRKPAFWILLIALSVCVVVAVCFATDPRKADSLKWLQNLSTDQVRYIEVYDYAAPPEKQYTRYEEPEILNQIVERLQGFNGTAAAREDAQSPAGSGYTMTVWLTDGTSHILVNHGNRYLQIDDDYFADSSHLLPGWDFSGTTYLPGYEPAADSFYGVSLSIEEVSPAGATVVFVGEGAGTGFLLSEL